MTDARLAGQVAEVVLSDIQNVQAILAGQLVQVVMRIDPDTVSAVDAAQLTVAVVQVLRGNYGDDDRRDIIDNHERKFAYDMARGPNS